MNLSVLFYKPRYSHSKLLKSYHVDAEEKVWIYFSFRNTSVNKRSYEESELDHTNEKDG